MTLEAAQETEAPEVNAVDAAYALEAEIKADTGENSSEDATGGADTPPATPEPSEGTETTEEPPKDAEGDSTQTAQPADDFQTKFDNLLDRERTIREREESVKAAEAAGLSQTDVAKLAKEDPIAFLEKFGISYDELTDSILDSHDSDPKVKGLEDRIAKFENADKERALKQEQAAMQAQVDKYVADVNAHIENSDYEIVKAMNGGQLVLDTITAYYRENGKELSVDEACKQVEGYLTEHELPKMQKLLETQKGKEMFGSTGTGTPTIKPRMPTLSNNAATQSPRKKEVEGTESAIDRAYRLEEQLKRNT